MGREGFEPFPRWWRVVGSLLLVFVGSRGVDWGALVVMVEEGPAVG